MSDSRSDDVLLAAWRAGDEDAFALIYERYETYVRKVALDKGRAQDIDDIAQAAWLHAFQYGRKATVPIKPMLRLAIKHAASEFYKKKTGDGQGGRKWVQRTDYETLQPEAWWRKVSQRGRSREVPRYDALPVDAKLTSVERHVLEGLFVRNETLVSIGLEIERSAERVRQIRNGAIAKIRLNAHRRELQRSRSQKSRNSS